MKLGNKMQHRSKEGLAYIKKMKPIWDEKYLRSEKGFFKELWHGLKNRCDKNSGYHKLNKRTVQVNNGIRNRDHLLELWEKQKKLLGGPYCIYTGVELTTVKNSGKGYNGCTDTNISIDRIDPNLPYQEDNIVFCSWEFNNIKGAVSPEDCKKILKVYEEHCARD